MMKNLFKQIWPELAAVLFFILLSFTYFATPVSQGLVLTGQDNTAAVGAGKEIGDHFDRTGEVSRWTNSLFSGMPTYQIAPRYGSRTVLNTLRSIYELGLPSVVMYVFILLLGFYILMRALNFRPLVSVVGAVAWAFSSYFFIIIGAGHIWKVLTLAFIPPTIAGVVLCYRGKYVWGGAVTALFLAFQILSNHLQMTYYFLPVLILMILAYFVRSLRQREFGTFVKGSISLCVAVLIAMAANASNLYHTYTYSKESMRGKSELASAGQSKSSGLSKEYITQWSYGIGETWTLLIPNAKGGASVPISHNERAMAKANPQFQQIYQQIGQYWGDQPGTSGPVYVGAFILFLFVLSLFIVKGPMKWALLAATIMSIMLSWGHNFMGLTSFFIDHVPLYNKFRTVSSILVVAEFCIPLLAVMGLSKILADPKVLKEQFRWFYVSLALTAGICLLFALMPSAFFASFISASETQGLSRAFGDNPQMGQAIIANLTEMRQSLFVADAWRSFLVIMIGASVLWIYGQKKLKGQWMVLLIGVLCLVDMYGVNRRYLNDNNFEMPRADLGAPSETQTDQLILQDKSLDYRVLNLASNTFNENETSYFHKSVGGYNAAKLGRYQDLIEHCIAPEMQQVMNALVQAQGKMENVAGDSLFPVLNMLNTKYFIMPLQGGQTAPLPNPYTNGNAWFVDQLTYVDNANAEITALHQLNLKHQAVAEAQFRQVLGEAVPVDSTCKVQITQYDANELHYTVSSAQGGVVVFSEIYYPGWTATIDGQPLSLGRADYTLRAARVPAGEHEIMMEFRPSSVKVTEAVAYGAIVVLILAFFASLVVTLRGRKETKKQ